MVFLWEILIVIQNQCCKPAPKCDYGYDGEHEKCFNKPCEWGYDDQVCFYI